MNPASNVRVREQVKIFEDKATKQDSPKKTPQKKGGISKEKVALATMTVISAPFTIKLLSAMTNYCILLNSSDHSSTFECLSDNREGVLVTAALTTITGLGIYLLCAGLKKS